MTRFRVHFIPLQLHVHQIGEIRFQFHVVTDGHDQMT